MTDGSHNTKRKFWDYSLHGKHKVKPWDQKKLASQHYADLLLSSDNAYEEYHAQVLDGIVHCADTLSFAKTDDGLKLYQCWFCKNRLCPMCSWRRSMKRSAQLSQILQSAKQEHQGMRLLFVTLTVPNVKGCDLRTAIERINKGVHRLLGYKKVHKNLMGFVRQTEITVKREVLKDSEEPSMPIYETYESNDGHKYALSFHPHVHLLLGVKSTYFKDKANYISTDEYQELWERALQWHGQHLVVYAETAKGTFKKASAELSKYETKSKDYLQSSKDDLDSLTAQIDKTIIRILHHELKHLRLFSYGGIFNDLYKSLGYAETEDDLINTDSENSKQPLDKQISVVVAQWDRINSGYYIQEEGVTTVAQITEEYNRRMASFKDFKRKQEMFENNKLARDDKAKAEMEQFINADEISDDDLPF